MKKLACNLHDSTQKKLWAWKKTLICINVAIVSALQSKALPKNKSCKSAEKYLMHQRKTFMKATKAGLTLLTAQTFDFAISCT
jgi:hypothetical protein